MEGFSRLYCLLEGVDSLGKQGVLLSHHVLTLNNQAKGICQLNWYRTQILLIKRLGIRKLSNALLFF